jgi:outer membrane murein-binding lipoprotein Lpp
MAKALFGHVGVGTDLRLSTEVRRLRARVAQLEAELARVRSVNEALVERVDVSDELRELDAEPALT